MQVLLSPPNTNTLTHNSKLLARGWSPRPGATVLGKFGSPSPHLAWRRNKGATEEFRPGSRCVLTGQ